MKIRNVVVVLVLAFLSSTALAANAPDASENKKTDGYTKFIRSNVHFDINADATYVETVDYSIKVLDKKGIDVVNMRSISYSDTLSDLQIISANITKKNGKIVTVPKNNFQVESNTGDNGNAPMISDIKTKTVIYPDVEVGDTVNLTYKLIQNEAMFPKKFSYIQTFPKSILIDSTEVSITAHESLDIRTEARGIKGGETAKKDGKRHWLWTYENKEIAKPENISVSAFDYGPRLIITTFKDYQDLANAYESRARAKMIVSDRVQKLAEEIAGKAKDKRETVSMLYSWVSKNIHYAGNCIGIGSVVPHDINHILDNKIGDCKDHTLLLQALLAAKGIESSPSLINSGSIYSIPDLPTSDIFDHVINYIPSLDMYADSTSSTTPFGSLPISEEGKPTLHTTGFKEVSFTPPTDNSKHWGKTHVDIMLKADGSADAVLKSEMAGANAISAREFFRRVERTKFKEEVIKSAIKAVGLTGTGEYMHFDNTDTDEPTYSYELKYHIDNAVSLPGPVGIIIYPMIAYHYIPISYFTSSAVSSGKPLHKFPCSGGSTSIEVVLHIADGVNIVAAPKDMHLKSDYSTYDSTYVREGNTITSTRKIVDNTPGNVCDPDIFDKFKDIDQAVIKDLKTQVILQ